MSSSSDSASEYKIPNDHVALVLLEDRGSSFYLQVPLTIIRASCLKPLKYLLYLGWCILSAEGVLSLERDDNDGIDTDKDAVGGEIYYYVLAAPLGSFISLSRVHRPREAPASWCPRFCGFEAQKSSNPQGGFGI